MWVWLQTPAPRNVLPKTTITSRGAGLSLDVFPAPQGITRSHFPLWVLAPLPASASGSVSQGCWATVTEGPRALGTRAGKLWHAPGVHLRSWDAPRTRQTGPGFLGV